MLNTFVDWPPTRTQIKKEDYSLHYLYYVSAIIRNRFFSTVHNDDVIDYNSLLPHAIPTIFSYLKPRKIKKRCFFLGIKAFKNRKRIPSGKGFTRYP